MSNASRKTAASPTNATLEAMKDKVQELWRTLGRSRGAERARVQGEYEKALSIYNRQKEILGGKEGETPKRSAAIYRLPPDQRPNPFDFTDYHEFLIGWLKRLKATQGITLKKFAEQAGIESADLVRALRRWKGIPPETFRKIIQLFEITETERAFLEVLHCLCETDSPAVRQASLNQLLNFAQFRTNNPLEYEAWRYLSHWYYVGIRELSTLPGFIPEPGEIQSRLRAPVEFDEISKALEFLEGAGFFKIREDGTVETLVKEVQCQGGVYRMALAGFHKQILEYAASAMQKVPSTQRFFLGKTFTVSQERYEQIRKIMEETLKRIDELGTESQASDEVYHLEIFMVPLTRARRR